MIIIIDFIGFLLSGELISAISCCNGVKNGEWSARCPGELVWGEPPTLFFVILQGGGQTLYVLTFTLTHTYSQHTCTDKFKLVHTHTCTYACELQVKVLDTGLMKLPRWCHCDVIGVLFRFIKERLPHMLRCEVWNLGVSHSTTKWCCWVVLWEM